MPNRQYVLGCVLFVLIALAIGGGLWWKSRQENPDQARIVRELAKRDLILRDGRLYAAAENNPFDGVLFENFPSGKLKLKIEIVDGQAHGKSVGYFENGQLEVEEFFVEGISHGLRTRWYEAGSKKSEEHIAQGKLNGRQRMWHKNGNMAVEMTLVNGLTEGLAQAWHDNGSLKSKARFTKGKMTDREIFEVSKPVVQAENDGIGP